MESTPKFLDTRQAARDTGFSEVTFKVWRQNNTGPPYVKFGDSPQSRVLYPRAELDAWIESRTVRPGEDAER